MPRRLRSCQCCQVRFIAAAVTVSVCKSCFDKEKPSVDTPRTKAITSTRSSRTDGNEEQPAQDTAAKARDLTEQAVTEVTHTLNEIARAENENDRSGSNAQTAIGHHQPPRSATAKAVPEISEENGITATNITASLTFPCSSMEKQKDEENEAEKSISEDENIDGVRGPSTDDDERIVASNDDDNIDDDEHGSEGGDDIHCTQIAIEIDDDDTDTDTNHAYDTRCHDQDNQVDDDDDDDDIEDISDEDEDLITLWRKRKRREINSHILLDGCSSLEPPLPHHKVDLACHEGASNVQCEPVITSTITEYQSTNKAASEDEELENTYENDPIYTEESNTCLSGNNNLNRNHHHQQHDTTKGPHFTTCFVCGSSLTHMQSGIKGRLNHIKRCSKRHGVTARHVRYDDEYELFDQQQQKPKWQQEGHQLPKPKPQQLQPPQNQQSLCSVSPTGSASDSVSRSASKVVNPYSRKSDWHGNAAADLAQEIITHHGPGEAMPCAMLSTTLLENSGETTCNNAKPSAFNMLMAGARRAAKVKKIQENMTTAATGPASHRRKRRQWGNGRGGGGRGDTGDVYTRRNSPCPTYKKIPGTDFVCDGFQYAQPTLTNSYFLTHFHADHYGGITRSWNAGTIYCSLPTANLVHEQLGVDRKWLHPLPMNTPNIVESQGKAITVTLLDANHCPGAVMFLFHVNKRFILHVGDFRWNNPLMTSFPPLQPFLLGKIRLDDLMLDTTYCDARYAFSTQEDTIRATVEVAVSEYESLKRQNKQMLLLFGAYTIGKERIYLSVAERLGLKVYVDHRRYRILKALQWPANRMAMLTTRPTETCLWVVPLGHINMKKLQPYLSVTNGGRTMNFDAVIGFRPTGWSHSAKGSTTGRRAASTAATTTNSIVKTQRKGNFTVHSVPYSEHSSFPELVDCVRSLKPRRIIPTVSVAKSQQQIDLLLQHAQLKPILLHTELNDEK